MSVICPVESPDSPAMNELCQKLESWADRWRSKQHWPADSLQLCARAGVYRWFLPSSEGGFGWNDVDQTRGYLRLAGADLTTTFIITQYMGACRRIVASENQSLAEAWIPRLISGQAFATVGISHLTTSRQHLGRPALTARHVDHQWQLDGASPWVTGAAEADLLVVGASLDDGRELLCAVPADSPGVVAGEGVDLIALSASKTDRVAFEGVRVDSANVLAGPVEHVMKSGTGAGTGGLQTSTLAVGLSRAATRFLADEAARRSDLREASDELNREVQQLEADLLRGAAGDESCEAGELRGRANRLVLRTTQAAMTAAKGAGFVEGHAVGRWCREALFFLVWSCPQPVAQAHLCELAGIRRD